MKQIFKNKKLLQRNEIEKAHLAEFNEFNEFWDQKMREYDIEAQ